MGLRQISKTVTPAGNRVLILSLTFRAIDGGRGDPDHVAFPLRSHVRQGRKIESLSPHNIRIVETQILFWRESLSRAIVHLLSENIQVNDNDRHFTKETTYVACVVYDCIKLASIAKDILDGSIARLLIKKIERNGAKVDVVLYSEGLCGRLVL